MHMHMQRNLGLKNFIFSSFVACKGGGRLCGLSEALISRVDVIIATVVKRQTTFQRESRTTSHCTNIDVRPASDETLKPLD